MKAKVLFVAAFVVPVILPLLALLSILSVIARQFAALLAKKFRPELSQLLTGYGLIYSNESIYEKGPKVNIVAHHICDGKIQLDSLRRRFEQRVTSCRDHAGNFKYHQLRQTWTQFCGFTFWKWDTDFSLSNHIRLYDHTEPELAITSSPCTEEDLKWVTGTLISKPYVKGRSPWEMLLIPDYQFIDTDGRTCNGSVVTLKIHHGLADGYSIFKLMNALFDKPSTVPSANFPKPTALQQFIRMAIMVLRFPIDVAQLAVLSNDDANSWHITDRKLTGRYIAFTSDRIPTSTIKAIRNKYGVGYNTVVYAIVAGATARLMREAGQKIPKSMTSFIPFPLPNHPDGLVNHWTAMMFRFSPGAANAANRLKEIASQLNDPRSFSTLPTSYSWFTKLMVALPTPLLRLLLQLRVSIVMTSFPGPEKPAEFMDGVRIVEMLTAGSNSIGTAGAVAQCQTMAGHQRILLNVDQLIFHGYSVPENFEKLVNQEVNELLGGMKKH